MIAVTGITGHSGGFLLQNFIDNKYDGVLRCFVRASSNTSKLDNSGLNIEKVVGSFDNEDDVFRLVNGADTVIHIAGIWKTPAILKAVEKAGNVKHVIVIHTTGIFSKHKIASEEYKEVEKGMQPYLDRGMNVTILRPTMIFGDMRDLNVSKFIRMVDKFPVMPEINHGAGLIQPVNARDIGQACYKAAMHEKLPQLSYVVSGEQVVSMHELFDMIGSFLGKKIHHISCPMGIGVCGAKLVKRLTKKDYIEKVLRMGEDRCFSHEDASRDFGYEPEKFAVGLRREVEEYISGGRK